MKTRWIAWMAPALLATAISGTASAGGFDGRHGYYGGQAVSYGYGQAGQRGYRHGYRFGHRGSGRHYAPPRRAWRHGYRQGYRHANRYANRHGYRHGYREFRRGYGYGYRHGHRRSYYPAQYRYDPALDLVRGIFYPYGGGISLHFGY